MNPGNGHRSRALTAMLVLALAAAATTTAVATDARGTLRLPGDFGAPPDESEEESRRNHYWDEWNGFLDPRPRGFDAARDLAVVLTGEGPMVEPEERFAIANGGLWPTTLVERAGRTLEIVNTDPVTHQLYAEGLEGFGETPLSPGRMRPVQVPNAGDWPLRDRLYEHVRGHLHVLPDLVARARVESDGSYRFTNLTPGTYTLKVFHGADMVHSQDGVVVEQRDLTLEPIHIGAPR